MTPLLPFFALMALAQAKSTPTHLEQLRARYPYGLIGDDYGILTEEDLAVNTCTPETLTPFVAGKNMAYSYWQCFSVENTKAGCDSTGYDPHEKREFAHFGIDAKNEDGLQSYLARDAMDMRDCKDWVLKWNKKTKQEKYVCISGSDGAFTEIRNGVKETGWVFDKFKTRGGCESFFAGECRLEKHPDKNCVLPESWTG